MRFIPLAAVHAVLNGFSTNQRLLKLSLFDRAVLPRATRGATELAHLFGDVARVITLCLSPRWSRNAQYDDKSLPGQKSKQKEDKAA